MLTAHTLGGFSLRDDKGRDVPLRSRKARALMGYLLVSGGTAERREKLASLLWSESTTEQAFDSLRHCISELRRAERSGGYPFLEADRETIRIDRSKVRTDLEELKSHLSSGEIAACRHLLTQPQLALLAGAEADDPVFDNWLLVERERQGEALVNEMLGVLRKGSLDARDRIDLARAIEQFDPYQEDAIRIHMELLADEGNIVGAMAFFERYRSRLLREYEVDPSDELLDFAEGLPGRGGDVVRAPKLESVRSDVQAATPSPPPAGSAPATAASGRGAPIIAVLSLASTPQSDQLGHLVDAFAHELVSTLCRFKEWTVTAPGKPMEATMQTGSDAALDDLVKHGVDYALVTSIATVAGATAINVRLVECDSRAVVISDQYPASLENWVATLNDICCRIASRTKTSLIAARLRKVTGKSIEQMQAYDLWLEGEVLADLWQRETEEKAIKLFSRALELDGNLAGAYAGWASVLNSRWIMYPGLPTEADREQAYQLAKRAVALDPLNNQTQGNLGWCHILAGRYEPAELHFGLAYDLNPSNPDNLLACGLGHAFCGNHARARELSRRAFDLNPFPQPYYYGYRANIDLLGRDFAGCIEAVNHVPDFFPDIQAWAAASYAHLGDLAAARAALDRYLVDIRKLWAGPADPSDDILCNWIVGVFPIRNDADRQLLADGLRMIPRSRRQKNRG